jgi:CheY-specific phosphatase CheX
VSHARDTVVHEFLSSAILLIRATTGVDAEVDVCRRSSPEMLSPTVAVHIGASGALDGITWVFPTALVVEMIKRALPGMEPRPALREAAATELANILTGRCAETLALHGISVEIKPPMIVSHIADGVCVHLASKVGVIDVVFHLRKPA